MGKRKFPAVCAVTLTFVLCSFSNQPLSTDIYMVYIGGSENAPTSYNPVLTSPGIIPNFPPLTLAWAKFTDDNGTITWAEFNTEFEKLDVVNDAANLLSDEVEDHVNIELK